MKVVSILFAAVTIPSVTALICWTCENQLNNEKCLENGRMKRCRSGQNACQSEVRRERLREFVTKRCKQKEACDNNYIQNPRAAWVPSQCNRKSIPSVCRCCCEKDLCNMKRLDCINGDYEEQMPEDEPRCLRMLVPRFGKRNCDPPIDDFLAGRSVKLGTSCTFSCKAGYEIKGSSETKCIQERLRSSMSTRFDHRAPICRPLACYPRRYDPLNGRISCTKSNLIGSICTYSCNKGFKMEGNNQVTCEPDKQWSNPSPRCLLKQCTQQSAPTNGKVECSNSNFVFSNCRFSCNAGYSVNGRRNTVCLNDDKSEERGVWSNPPPTCRRITCDSQSSPQNGAVTCTNLNNAGSQCTFSCDGGYKLNGRSRAVCRDDGDGDDKGIWSSPTPTCIRLTCNPPQASPVNGDVTCTNKNFENSRCTFNCELGYRLTGQKSTLCEDDNNGDDKGLWSNPSPTCVRIKITCNPLQRSPINGQVRCTDRNNERSLCTFTCNSGYNMNGQASTTCEDDRDGDDQGKWSNPAPICERITCSPAHRNPNNGVVTCTDRNNEGSLCSFTCNTGYLLVGSDESTCVDDNDGDADGVWNEKAPICTGITCSEQSALGNGSVSCTANNNFGSTCAFDCDSGYFLNGASATTCEDDEDDDVQGVWNNPRPICEVITCNLPHNVLRNGRVGCNALNNLGSLCRFTCNSGYFLDGSDESTCVDDNDGDADGVWNEPAPTCIQITCNPERIAPGNGSVSCSDRNNFGSICSFSCNNNFALVGSDTSVCNDNDDGDALGEWSSESPVCQLKGCGAPPDAPENGGIVCSETNVVGSRCEFTCDDYHTRVGPLYTTCVEDVSNNIRTWDNTAPVCQPNVCPAQNLPHGRVRCDDGDLDATTNCTFECVDPDYQLYPPNITENRCLNDSTWNIPRPCCTRPCPPYALLDFVIVLDSSSSVGDGNWVLMTTFVRGIIQQFNLGNDSARIGVFRYNRAIDTTTEIALNRFTNNREDLVAAFNNIPYDGRGTRTGQALEYASDTFFSSAYGNRPGVKDVLLIITDGRSQDSVAEPAKKLRDKGVLIFVLGVQPDRGVLNINQLNQIADDPNHVFIASSFAQLQEFDKQITDEVCEVDPCAHDPRP